MCGMLASCVASCCDTCAYEANARLGGNSRQSARIAYCALFIFSVIYGWALRYFIGPLLLSKIPWITNHFGPQWFEADALVLRVSLASFLFFTTFAVLMIGVKDERDFRDSWHHGGWMAKMVAWFSLLLLSMFFVSNDVIGVYEKLCKFGSVLFLLIQLILLLDFTHAWNDAWASKDHQLWYLALFLISSLCYIITFSFSRLLFHWFSPWSHGCTLNTFFIAVTVILALAFAIVALHPSVNGSLLPASVISLYCAYLCYSGLSSEPRNSIEYCNCINNIYSIPRMVGIVTTVLSLGYSAVRAGSNSTASMLKSPRYFDSVSERTPLLLAAFDHERLKDEGRPVTYSYSLFHLIFAAASMYSAMLLTGWTSVGWPSVWLHICVEWIGAALYIWTLLAPLIFPGKEFS